MTSDQFLVTSDQFDMSDDQNWSQNQLVTVGHDKTGHKTSWSRLVMTGHDQTAHKSHKTLKQCSTKHEIRSKRRKNEMRLIFEIIFLCWAKSIISKLIFKRKISSFIF
jgi:hypothetical protein